MRACKTKTTTNKSKMTKNDCDGIMGKSKQVAICVVHQVAVLFSKKFCIPHCGIFYKVFTIVEAKTAHWFILFVVPPVKYP